MSLAVFDSALHEQQQAKPRVRLLEVRDKLAPDGEVIALVYVQREERYRPDGRDGFQMHTASIRLAYETIEPKHSRRAPCGETFIGSYSRGYGKDNESVSLVETALFVDPMELRGQRVGTYLMNEIVNWAQQWPEATVNRIKLLSGQADEENLPRRNRFYERFGLVFEYHDPEHREGVSKPMPVKDLNPVASWQQNITERDPREYIAQLLYERERMVMEAAQRDRTIKNLSKQLKEAEDRPARWAAQRLWWRVSAYMAQLTLVLLVIGALVWGASRVKAWLP